MCGILSGDPIAWRPVPISAFAGFYSLHLNIRKQALGLFQNGALTKNTLSYFGSLLQCQLQKVVSFLLVLLALIKQWRILFSQNLLAFWFRCFKRVRFMACESIFLICCMPLSNLTNTLQTAGDFPGKNSCIEFRVLGHIHTAEIRMIK